MDEICIVEAKKGETFGISIFVKTLLILGLVVIFG